MMCPSMRNPSGGAPVIDGNARAFANPVSIDEKPVRRCAADDVRRKRTALMCPSMRNPSGGAP